MIPLVGRAAAFGHLREGWARALAGNVHLTLVTGEAGVGKTRLIKSFLDATTSKRRSIVLKGQCYELSPLVAYQPFVEVLRGALAEEMEAVEQVLAPVPDGGAGGSRPARPRAARPAAGPAGAGPPDARPRSGGACSPRSASSWRAWDSAAIR